MVLAYLFGQLQPWMRSSEGFLLVLGTGNSDEGLRGYMTKYDCSSADLNPIGGINKIEIGRFLRWSSKNHGLTALDSVLEAAPTAELRPFSEDNKKSKQTDEEEMGMTYKELQHFGLLRKIGRMGPVSMFRELCEVWKELTPA